MGSGFSSGSGSGSSNPGDRGQTCLGSGAQGVCTSFSMHSSNMNTGDAMVTVQMCAAEVVLFWLGPAQALAPAQVWQWKGHKPRRPWTDMPWKRSTRCVRLSFSMHFTISNTGDAMVTAHVCCRSSSGSGSGSGSGSAPAQALAVEVAHQTQATVDRHALEAEHKVCAVILQHALQAISNTGDAMVTARMCCRSSSGPALAPLWLRLRLRLWQWKWLIKPRDRGQTCLEADKDCHAPFGMHSKQYRIRAMQW